MAAPTNVPGSTKKSDTAIFNHNCQNDGQDRLHGKNQRVMNACTKGWCCTVCGGIRGV